MNNYIPEYLDGIQDDLKAILAAAEHSADYIENGPAYQNRLHPFHAAAVSTYNKLVSILIETQNYIISD